MELRADGGPLTATAIARHLGIHQSSASRLLGVLLRAGFVRKPAYHSFALDYGALAFAGRSMGCFPAIGASVEVCNRIARETGYDATVGLLWKGHLLYLTRTNADSSLVLIENSSFPIHESSLGLFLSWEQGKKECLHAVRASLIACGQDPRRAEGIYRAADSTIARHGFLYLENTGNNLFNASLTFELDGRRAALAVFSSRRRAASEKARSLGFGAGMGLTNMRRCADEFRISSELERGTRVEMHFRPRPPSAKEELS